MKSAHGQFDQAVEDIYASASGLQPWRDALASVTHCLNSWTTHLMALDKRSGSLLFSEAGGHSPPAANLDFILDYHQIDPRVPILLTFEVGRWLHCHDYVSDALAAAHPFYQEFLIPYGGRYTSAVKLQESDDTVVVLGAHRGRDSRPFQGEELAVLDFFKEHLVAAQEIYLRLRAATLLTTAGTQLLDELDVPMALLDEQRGLRYRNVAFAQSLSDADCIVERSGSLVCLDAQADLQLTMAIQALRLGDSDAGRLECGRCIALRCPGCPTRLTSMRVRALRPRNVMGAFGPTPLALLILHDPQRQPGLDAFAIGQTFDLTPAEAKVAVAVAQGHSVKTVALNTGNSVATVRTHLRSIFPKLGASHQSDLVRTLQGFPPLRQITSMTRRLEC